MGGGGAKQGAVTAVDAACVCLCRCCCRPQLLNLDTRMAGLIGRIDELRRRRALLLGFAAAPAEFVDGLVGEQVGAAAWPLPGGMLGGWKAWVGRLGCLPRSRERPIPACGPTGLQGFEVRRSQAGGTDAYDAVASSQAYHERWCEEAAIKYLQDQIPD